MNVLDTEFIHFGNKYDPNLLNIRDHTADYSEYFLCKPNGLWACARTFDKTTKYNSQWSDYCKDNDFCTENLKEGFTFNLNKDAKILTINNLDDLKPYITKGMSKLHEPLCFSLQVKIDFNKIYSKFDGMYVPFLENYAEFHHSILNAYDVDSLCIWNSSAIKHITNFNQ